MRRPQSSVSKAPAWDQQALEDPHAQPDKALRVQRMFDVVAPTYERVNTVTSLGRDAAWRRKTVVAANVRRTDVVLDVCCGTGDMIRAFAAHSSPPRLIIGIDFAAQMLAHGVYGAVEPPVQLCRADALRLPLHDLSVDVISCAFGVRNFQDLRVGLREMLRVLRPGGRVVILEFALPESRLFRWGYRLYTGMILPRLAAVLSREPEAYRYLPKSIQTFERRSLMAQRLKEAGFTGVTTKPLVLGGVVIYRGEKPGPD